MKPTEQYIPRSESAADFVDFCRKDGIEFATRQSNGNLQPISANRVLEGYQEYRRFLEEAMAAYRRECSKVNVAIYEGCGDLPPNFRKDYDEWNLD